MNLPLPLVPRRWERFGILVVAYGLLWITMEGALWSVLVMGGLTAIWLIMAIFARWGNGRQLTRWWGIFFFAASGLVAAGLWVILALIFMAFKTGLHAHGPEFTAAEISWLWQQLGRWLLLGGLSGLGLGFIWAGIPRSSSATTNN
jgi:hypothetical protein